MQMWFPPLNKDWERSTFKNHSLRWEPTFPCVLHRDETHKTNSTENSFKRLEHVLYDVYVHVFLLSVPCTQVQAKHLTYIEKSFILGRRVLHTCDVLLTLLEDVLGLHRKPLWQVWEDILSLYKSKPKWALTGSIKSLLLTARCDFSQHRPLFL